MTRTARIYQVTPLLAQMFLFTAKPFVVKAGKLDRFRTQLQLYGKFVDLSGDPLLYDFTQGQLLRGHHPLLAILIEDKEVEVEFVEIH